MLRSAASARRGDALCRRSCGDDWPSRASVSGLAVGGAKRASVPPDIPTTQEAGFADSAYSFWVGMKAPAGVPPAVVGRLNAEVKKALTSPEVAGRLSPLAADAAPRDAASFNKLIARELEDNARLVREAGIKLS